ncbi:MAG TPA: CotH kinase family protein [Polyangium sp.]|nr:CotH kinase family protein [Polyangium sp.]
MRRTLGVVFSMNAICMGCSSGTDPLFGASSTGSSSSMTSTSSSSSSSSGDGGAGGMGDTPPDYALLYDIGKINEFTITFTAADWAALEADRQKNKMLPNNQRDFIYVPCTVSFNGETWKDVGLRYKGNSSFNIPGVKESFKLDFNEYVADQNIHGIKKMNFNNGFKDPTMLRECLSLEMYQNAGVVAPRCAYARINYDLGDGQGPRYWGLYTNIEQVDKTFLTDRFTAALNDGNLYKPDGPGADLSMFSQTTYEKKTNETAADYTDIMALIQLLPTLNDAASIKAKLEPILNVDGFIRFLAINNILTSWDAYPGTGHNYYIYNNPKNKSTTGQDYWEYIVWDANEAFGNFIPMPKTAYDNLNWPWDQPFAMNQKVLITKVLMVPEWRTALGDYMKKFLKDAQVFEPVAAQARADELHQFISDAVHQDKNYLFPTANPDVFTQGLTQDVQGGPQGVILAIRPYISGRAMFLNGSIP